jgi:hypothetical protein
MIFGCRQGCEFSDIMRALERLGLVESKKLSPEKLRELRINRKVGFEAFIWAQTILDIGSLSDAEYAKAQAILRKANDVGVEPVARDWAWKLAEIRERGLINEHR